MTSRSHGKVDSAPALSRAVYKNQFGTVRVYTRRHINGCPLPSPDHNHCSCPKWIYAKPRGEELTQKTANTPSFAEACGQAQKILRGFDPEIRAAREIASPAPGISIVDALARYFAVLERRNLKPRYIAQIHRLFEARGERAKKHPWLRNPSLSDFLAELNPRLADPITRVEQLSTDVLDDWMAAWRSNDLTSGLWRSQAATFFNWALARGYLPKGIPSFTEAAGTKITKGNRCGHFTDEQMRAILAALAHYQGPARRIGPAWVIPTLPQNYTERLRAFIALGRWGGMAVCDIVMFDPGTNLSARDVLSYRRLKTGEIAQVLLPPELAACVRSIPPEHGSDPAQPFRFRAYDDEANRRLWRLRFQKLCARAGITEIATESGTVRKPHPHMLRDTFAIDAITRGVDLTNVAKMLGHATVAMTQRAYLFWIAKRVDYCIEDQRAALARRVDIDIASAAAEWNSGTALPPTVQ